MNAELTSRVSLTRALAAFAVLGAGVLAGGCSASAGREAYFESRGALVAAKPGTGETRFAFWPSQLDGQGALASLGRGTAPDDSADTNFGR